MRPVWYSEFMLRPRFDVCNGIGSDTRKRRKRGLKATRSTLALATFPQGCQVLQRPRPRTQGSLESTAFASIAGAGAFEGGSNDSEGLIHPCWPHCPWAPLPPQVLVQQQIHHFFPPLLTPLSRLPRAGQETPLVKEVERETEAGWGECWVEGVLVFSAGWSEVIDS